MLRHLVDMEAKARMPFERTLEFARERFDLGVAKAWVENERVHVGGKATESARLRRGA